MPETLGIGHVTLTVSDVKRSAEFYNGVFDTQTVLDVVDQFGPFMAVASTTLVLGFRTHESTNRADAFDPTRVGLDHFAFLVADQAAIEAWESRLDEQDVSHSGVFEDPNGARHLNFRDPDGIALEFYLPAPQN
ncbi:VOC family protein [Streptomyces sp. NBC_01351]|uniref:VOC family protein n=1 Tax=Streptomyces sp. NBC_01351 TaxID=2903833 RepID=UPI002E33106E|nr:VOC family protein [Streptomyces sp. NBC_01351]